MYFPTDVDFLGSAISGGIAYFRDRQVVHSIIQQYVSSIIAKNISGILTGFDLGITQDLSGFIYDYDVFTAVLRLLIEIYETDPGSVELGYTFFSGIGASILSRILIQSII